MECRVWAILKVEAVWTMGFIVAARLLSGGGFTLVALSVAGSGVFETEEVMVSVLSWVSSSLNSGSAMDTRLDIRRTFGGRFMERRAEWLVLRAGGRGRSRDGESEEEEGCCWRRGLRTSVILTRLLWVTEVATTGLNCTRGLAGGCLFTRPWQL